MATIEELQKEKKEISERYQKSENGNILYRCCDKQS